jgi:hypothetical protein
MNDLLELMNIRILRIRRMWIRGGRESVYNLT